MKPFKMLVITGLLAVLTIALVVYAACVGGPEGEEEQPMEEPAAAVAEVAPTPTEEPAPITAEEVCDELRAGLSEPWEAVPDARMYDTCAGILRLAEQRGQHPLIMADEVAELAETVITMQPELAMDRHGGLPRALDMAWDFHRATTEIGSLQCPELSDEFATFDRDDSQVPRVSPYVLLAMAHRESRLALRTERGWIERRGQKTGDCLYCRGGAGERGMFQFMPAGGKGSNRPGATERRFHPGERPCDPFDRWCATQTAVKAMAVFRCECIREYGERCTVDSFVASYGVTRLISPENARHHRGNEKARAFLCVARDDCDQWWPRDHDDAFALSL